MAGQPPPSSVEQNVLPALQPKFGLWRGAWICFGIAVLIVLPPGMASPMGIASEQLATAVGGCLAMLSISLFLAWLAFYAARRSRKAANITFVVCVCLGVLAQLSVQANRAAANEARRRLEAQSAQSRDAALEQVRKTGTVDMAKAQQAAKRLADAADDSASQLPSDEAAMARAIASFVRRCTKQGTDFQDALATVTAKTPFQPTWLKTRADLDQARANIRRVLGVIDENRRFHAGIGQVLAEELGRQKVPANLQASCTAPIMAKFDRTRPIATRLHDENTEGLQILLQACDLLEEQWGRWQLAEQQTVLFQDRDTARRFSTLRQSLLAIAAKQSKDNEEYLKALQ